MKRTLSINLGGIPFQIDEDAYRLLEKYLNDLKSHFRKEEGVGEIIQDIEARIAELLQEKLSLNRVIITQSDVEEVIARIGSPEEMSDGSEDREEAADEEATDSGKAEAEGKKETGQRVVRRLFRNPDDKIISGVLGGLAAYFHLDASVLRLVVLVFGLMFSFFTPWLLVISYLVCWILIPEAHTASEKLSMRGESVTVENIGKTVIEDFEEGSSTESPKEKSRSDKKPDRFIDRVMQVIGVVLKACLILFAIVFSPVLFALAVALFVFIFIGIMTLFVGGSFFWNLLPFGVPEMFSSTGIWGSLGMILAVGIPLATLIYLVFQSLFHWRPMPAFAKWTLLILWIVSLVGVLVFSVHGGWGLGHHCSDDFLQHFIF